RGSAVRRRHRRPASTREHESRKPRSFAPGQALHFTPPRADARGFRVSCFRDRERSERASGTGVLSSRDTKERRGEGSCSVPANALTDDHETGTAVPRLLKGNSSRAEELPSLPSCL